MLEGAMKKILGGLVLVALSSAAGAQVVLNASSWVPPAHPLTANMLVPLCDDIARVTSGRVKCNVLPKPPVAAPQTFDGVANGLMDLSFTTHGYTPGRFALTEAPEFPFMGDTAEVTAVAYQRIHERMLAKADVHEGVVTDVAKALGAVVILKPAPESYELLSSGVADGVFFPKESPASFKFIPLIKYATFVPGGLYNTAFVWMANPAKWNSIPEADRRLIQPLLGEALARRSGIAWDAADAKGGAAVLKALRAEIASLQKK